MECTEKMKTSKIAIIDIGSNSVRILYADGNFYNKELITTRLGEGLYASGVLSDTAIKRTVEGVKTLYKRALDRGFEKVYAFATASVREADNGLEFCKAVKKSVGLDVEVINGDSEALLGVLGAVGCADGGIVDIGGASSEVAYQDGGEIVYRHSLNIGAVKIYDICGRDKDKVEEFLPPVISKYPKFDGKDKTFYAIGGTATTLANVALNLKTYDPQKVNGYIITYQKAVELKNLLFSLSVEDIFKTYAVDSKRAEIIAGGASILVNIMQKFNLQQVVVSEGDNLEGYAIYRGLL